MKRAVAIILETILFLFVFVSGSFLPAFPDTHLPKWEWNFRGNHYLMLDGLVFMAILYLLFLVVGAARHRLRSAVLTSTVAVVLALVLGLAVLPPTFTPTH